MTLPALIERITRSLAYMLRHQPERFDLELDEYGFGAVEDVVRALNEALGERVDLEDLENAIASGDRPRYEIDKGRIRAGQTVLINGARLERMRWLTEKPKWCGSSAIMVTS